MLIASLVILSCAAVQPAPLPGTLTPFSLSAGEFLSRPVGVRTMGQAAEQIDGLVASLGDADPAVRRDAQRALGRLLHSAADRAPLAAALHGASAEARRRTARVLGREDRLLGLSIELSLSEEADVARVGREAINAQLLRWSPSVFDEPEVAVFDPQRQTVLLPRAWREGVSLDLALDPSDGGALSVFDRFDRLGGGPAPIILDPRVVERIVRRPAAHVQAARVDCSWAEMLDVLCAIHGLAYQVQGFRFPGEERASDTALNDAPGNPLGESASESPLPRAWVHIVPRGTTDLTPPGRDLRTPGGDVIVGFCLDARRDGDVVRKGAAARALAGLDWTAAITWLEQRWLHTGDVAALEGLLAGAARGRVAPSLQRADVLQQILALVDAEAREVIRLRARRSVAIADASIRAAQAELDAVEPRADRRVRRFAAGLARLAPVSSGRTPSEAGRLLLPVVFEGFDQAPPTGRWLRLVIAEGMGVRSEVANEQAIRGLLGVLPVRSRRQALRTLLQTREFGSVSNSSPGRPPVSVSVSVSVSLPDPGALFREKGVDALGLGLELGLARVTAEGDAWVTQLSVDLRANTDVLAEVLAEIVVWGALVVEASPTEPATAPAWVVKAVEEALAAEPRGSRLGGRRPDAFVLAAAKARGDVHRALAKLNAVMGPQLRPAQRAAFERRALRAGFAGAEERARALGAGLAVLESARAGAVDPAPARAVEDAWLDLAALVGSGTAPGSVGARSLEALEASLCSALENGASGPGGSTKILVAAAEAAVDSMRENRMDVASERFQDALRKAATRAKHPLASRFYSLDWPPEPTLSPRDLMRVEPPLPIR